MTGSLYIFWFLHQTTTQSPSDWNHRSCISFDSYIKPQLRICFHSLRVCCISFDSYIKPQLFWEEFNKLLVVYLLIPTSNHNSEVVIIIIVRVVYLLIPTSNHNAEVKNTIFVEVVYLLIPTSNHNWGVGGGFGVWLYIFWFLHQTTTHTLFWLYWIGCISFDSYIKPQLRAGSRTWCAVVYLLIPTSNHNHETYSEL